MEAGGWLMGQEKIKVALWALQPPATLEQRLVLARVQNHGACSWSDTSKCSVEADDSYGEVCCLNDSCEVARNSPSNDVARGEFRHDTRKRSEAALNEIAQAFILPKCIPDVLIFGPVSKGRGFRCSNAQAVVVSWHKKRWSSPKQFGEFGKVVDDLRGIFAARELVQHVTGEENGVWRAKCLEPDVFHVRK